MQNKCSENFKQKSCNTAYLWKILTFSWIFRFLVRFNKSCILMHLFFSHISYIPVSYDGQTVYLVSVMSTNYVTVLESFRNSVQSQNAKVLRIYWKLFLLTSHIILDYDFE